MEENKKCYTFETYEYKDAIFGNVDATYIIHLEGNGRYEKIQEQLKRYHPTHKVHLVKNRGFRKCKKSAHIETAAYDLIDAFLQIFKDAEEKQYGAILILEDDFQFDEKILDPIHRERICTFLRAKENQEWIYLLGCVPILQIPYDMYHSLVYSAGMHSVIYSPSYRKRILAESQTSIHDWDVYHNITGVSRYTYYTPLCYQLFPVTENALAWGSEAGGYIGYIFGQSGHFLFRTLHMDTSVDGYMVFYWVSKILFYVLVVFLLWILYGVYLWIRRSTIESIRESIRESKRPSKRESTIESKRRNK